MRQLQTDFCWTPATPQWSYLEFIWSLVDFTHGDIEGLKQLYMLLPWWANSKTERAALYNGTFALWPACIGTFQAASPTTQGCRILAHFHCLSFYFSTALRSCFMYDLPNPLNVRLRWSPSEANPPPFPSIEHCSPPHFFVIHTNKMCWKGICHSDNKLLPGDENQTLA